MDDRLHEKEVIERIAKDLANHQVKLLHSDGLYRHWRCGRPDSGVCAFWIITWPGHLCYTGDMGSYLFARVEDMVPFVREVCAGHKSIDYRYMAEKCLAADTTGVSPPIREWSRERFEAVLRAKENEAQDSVEDACDSAHRDQTMREIEEIREAYADYENQNDATKAMYESGLWDELPSCTVYTYGFLWCMHALRWFTAQFSDPIASPVQA